MTSKEALLFVGKCLSLRVHSERASFIQKIIQSDQVNWKSVVYQSSNQLVMPALYINLKRNGLLLGLPEELIAHFEDITNQNRKRNQSILSQIENIINLLRKNGLYPVFLKGSAHLLDGLYEDIGERMVGDIDFLLEEKDALKAFQILQENGYHQLHSFGKAEFGTGRHLPRLVNENEMAAIEIHAKLLNKKYDKTFGWLQVQNNLKKSKSSLGALVLSDTNLILHNMMNVQLNDKAKTMFKIFLRQSYDLMLLSKKKNPLDVCKYFDHYFKVLNSYIAISAELLDYPGVLDFERNKSAKRYIHSMHFIWENPKFWRFARLLYFIIFRIYRYIKTLLLFFINASTRKRVIASLSNPAYYKTHFEQYKNW